MSQESEFLKAFYLSQSIKQEILWYIQKTESSTWLVATVFLRKRMNPSRKNGRNTQISKLWQTSMPSDTKFGLPGQTVPFWSHSAVCRTACRIIRPCAHSQALCGKKERIQTERKPIVQIEDGNRIHERRVRRRTDAWAGSILDSSIALLFTTLRSDLKTYSLQNPKTWSDNLISRQTSTNCTESVLNNGGA